MWNPNPPTPLRDHRWFQDWLQGIVSQVATQQGFFTAIYEPVLVPGAIESEANAKKKSSIKEKEAEPASGIFKFSAVIGDHSKNTNSTDNNSTSKENTKKLEEEIVYTEEESDRVYVWGYFNYKSYFKPEVYKGLPGCSIVQVACGVDHTVFLTDLGKVYCSGQNTHYQLGDGTMMDHDNPTQVTKIDHLNITKISCGSSFTVALTDTGNVVMWGTLRHGDKYGTLVLPEPAFVKPLKRVNIIDIASGGAHILALGSDGTLYTWGNPMFGRLGRQIEFNNENDPRLPAPLTALQGTQVLQISCGEQHSILLTSEFKVYTWGQNSHRECTSDYGSEIKFPLHASNITEFGKVDQVRAGFRFSLVRIANKLYAWGAGIKPHFIDKDAPFLIEGTHPFPIPYCTDLTTDFRIVDMVAGSQHCLLLSEAGRVFSFGLSTHGQTGLGSPDYAQNVDEVKIDHRIDKIAAGGKTSIAVQGSMRSVLGQNMLKIINSQKMFGDVLLRPSDGQPMYAHKAILAVRSPLLKEVIIEAEKSASNGELPVLDFTKYTSKQLYTILVYTYTCRSLSGMNSTELTAAIKAFNVKDRSRKHKKSPPMILAGNLSELLVWRTYVAKSDEKAPPIVKNSNAAANEGLWSDIKFIVQGKEILAHKAILCANSEYFRLMFTGGMKESHQSVIEVQDDITFEAFVATLQFLYTDNIEVDVNLALDILPVASLYNLQRLRQKCEGIIEKQVETDSVAYVWQVARFNAAPRLESFCLELMMHKFSEVQTEAFKNLSKEDQENLSNAHWRIYPRKEI